MQDTKLSQDDPDKEQDNTTKDLPEDGFRDKLVEKLMEHLLESGNTLSKITEKILTLQQQGITDKEDIKNTVGELRTAMEAILGDMFKLVRSLKDRQCIGCEQAPLDMSKLKDAFEAMSKSFEDHKQVLIHYSPEAVSARKLAWIKNLIITVAGNKWIWIAIAVIAVIFALAMNIDLESIIRAWKGE